MFQNWPAMQHTLSSPAITGNMSENVMQLGRGECSSRETEYDQRTISKNSDLTLSPPVLPSKTDVSDERQVGGVRSF